MGMETTQITPTVGQVLYCGMSTNPNLLRVCEITEAGIWAEVLTFDGTTRSFYPRGILETLAAAGCATAMSKTAALVKNFPVAKPYGEWVTARLIASMRGEIIASSAAEAREFFSDRNMPA